MFIEKYRPKTFDDVVGQRKIVKVIRKQVEENKTIPNMLFAGDAGTGKTSLAIVIARALFGKAWRSSLLELNASSERGIDIIRGKVKEFVRTKGFEKIKIVFLDEASEITKDAQHALRRLMETYTDNCRFILTCNYINKIIEPIQSRCKVYGFSKLGIKALERLAKRVIKKEDIKIKKGQLVVAIHEANGDARRLLHTLESTKSGGEIELELLDDVYSFEVGEFVERAYTLDPDYIFGVMLDEVIKLKNKKAVILLAECDLRFRMGCVKTLQLISSFIQIKKALGG